MEGKRRTGKNSFSCTKKIPKFVKLDIVALASAQFKCWTKNQKRLHAAPHKYLEQSLALNKCTYSFLGRTCYLLRFDILNISYTGLNEAYFLCHCFSSPLF